MYNNGYGFEWEFRNTSQEEKEEDKLYWRGPTTGTASLLRTNM